MMVKKKNRHQINLGGGRDKPPWIGCPPPRYQFFSIFLTLKTSLLDLSCDFKSILILYLGCTNDGEEKKSTSKTWVGGEINHPGQVTPHPCTN